jgi:hypothetical protein
MRRAGALGIGVHRRPVRAEADERLLQGIVHILFQLLVVEAWNGALVVDQGFEENVEPWLLLVRDHLADALADVLLISGIGDSADLNPAPVAADRSVVVVPSRDALANVALEARPQRRIFEPGEHRFGAAIVRPRRDDVAQPGILSDGVRVDVRLHVEPFVARILDQADQFRHLSP